MACMCPVDHVCHQLTYHRRLFSLSHTRNRHFIALFTPIDFAISATPTSQRTLFTYLWYAWRQSWRCAKYSNSVYVAAFHEFLSMCEMTTCLKSATHFEWRPPSVHHVPRCRLPQFVKNCWVELLGLGLALGLQLRLGSVLVCMVTVSR